ncbi:zinc metalloprotease HtpX [Candidatus Woesearchaeota archaeon]|jgi:heat shock protein HtpX|nr:zinc metalloprotease HtpX [Candidatus Woesearchaeota archaeon]MBT4368724.1 zinc metalloprotease HtpX [Candidatus Woesearchaeota archaeon]MBT4712013.1 zinc metalloprotease HtpX [Candidatus Woesearchaeota archaeon]MBT6638908.1 zinc metalloprotease HtpX [Candidatus Woesearchaeota archaeon]MBT7134552.1 zinc metalloprotease HtpX [Candidatus Woesearchaeota archaeon]
MSLINNVKTFVLLGLLTALLLWVGSFWGYSGLAIALVLVLVMNLVSFWYSDKIVLKMYKAKEIRSAPVKELVKELAKEANIPMPKVYLIPSDAPNAFATGRSPEHAAVAVTQGILSALTKDELRGVLAHELAHIKNRDTLIQTVASVIAGVISYVAMMARFGAMFGGYGDRDGGRGIELLALAIITPLIAVIIQLAISRSREFLADERGAKLIRDGLPLASALEKLESSHVKLKFGSKMTSSLFIVNPFKGKALWKLLSTHPSTSVRVEKLKSMRW